MAENSSQDYKALFHRVEEEAELRRQAEERERQERELRRQAEERSQPTTFEELIKGCHNSFSQPLQSKTTSEKDLKAYERGAVEDHVHDIIAELCKIPNARERFRLGDGIMFENHGNLLQSEESDVQLIDESSSQNPKPDSFCIHQINGSTNTLITTVEYKPPHKLSVENLQMGLQLMRF
ncbi:hypothetical protein BDFG_07578 [Blastomyces dermatitidis ATCC 26199]|nr:hypothetical protein BDFG_07578 [Blastomyces dermatitidis ATCC 26199]